MALHPAGRAAHHGDDRLLGTDDKPGQFPQAGTMSKLILSLGIILSGLSCGYVIQRLTNGGILRLPMTLPTLRRRLQQIGLLFFMSISFMGAIWIAKVNDARVMALPFIGLAVLLSGGLLALAVARWLQLGPRQKGAYYACGSFTNIGSIGALLTFFFLGEAGFAFVPLYKLFEEVVYYTIGFPIAKFYSTDRQEYISPAQRLKNVVTDPFVAAALAAIMIGGGLNLGGVPRPAIFGAINAVFVPAGTFMLLMSIGLAMQFAHTKIYVVPGLAMAAIKFLALPALAAFLAHLAGLGGIMAGLPAKVVIILASMPVAFTALIPPSIYDLDLDLANTCWLMTTLALLVVAPVLYIFVV
jgi:predicted permease